MRRWPMPDAVSSGRSVHRSAARWPTLVLIGALVFLYLPIAVVVVMAFNESGSPFRWSGFSTRWFSELAGNEAILRALGNTCLVAAGATALSVVLGTSLAIGLARYTRSAWLDTLALGPAVAPDIVMAIGLLALYITLGMTLGLVSVLLSHAVFGTALVTAIVRARLGHMDPGLEEASRDLGASALSTFFRITIRGVMPAVIAGGLLTFTLSLDEFVIAYFTDGPATPTLPIVIYSLVRFGITPEVNALGAVLLLVSVVTILVAQRLTGLGATE
jgi:spermidine/putrescine transport system permease protein